MGEDKFAQVHYLNELMEMTTHNLVGRCAQEHLHLLGSEGLLRPCLRTPASSQTLDDRESALSFSLSSVRCLLFRRGIISSTKLAREGARGSWGSQSEEGPLIHHSHVPGPKIGKRLILLGPHPSVHSLIKFCRHPYKRKTLVKKKKREDDISSMDELNTYSFFLNLNVS